MHDFSCTSAKEEIAEFSDLTVNEVKTLEAKLTTVGSDPNVVNLPST